MASAHATTRRYARVVTMAMAIASLLLIAMASAETTGEPADPDAADNQRIFLECTMRCVTEAMGCATRCAGARPDEAPVCAAACVQSDVGCLAGCTPPKPAGPDESTPPAPPVPPAA